MALKYKTSPLPLLRIRRGRQQCVGCRDNCVEVRLHCEYEWNDC